MVPSGACFKQQYLKTKIQMATTNNESSELYCRTCFSSSNDQIPITKTIFEYFEIYLSFKMCTHPKLPPKICLSCYNCLLKYRQFYLQCRDVEEFYKLQADIYREEYISEDLKNDADNKSENGIIDNGSEDIDSILENEIDYESENQDYEYEDIKHKAPMASNETFANETLSEQQDLSIQQYNVSTEIEECFSNKNGHTINIEIVEENNDFLENVILSEDTAGSSEYDEEFHHKCTECNKSFISLTLLQTHTQDVHKLFSCKNCNNKLFHTETEYKLHKQEHKNVRKIPCGRCEKQFASRYDLNIHSAIHTGEKPFECEVCHKRFRQKNTLKTHQALHYGKNVKCDLCDKKFARKSQLILHNRMHKNEKPFICDECGVAFRQMQDLSNHKFTHAGVKRIKCDVCPSIFYNKKGLYAHMNAVHPKKIFKCVICGQNYKKSLGLRKHLTKVHSILVDDVSQYKVSIAAANNEFFEIEIEEMGHEIDSEHAISDEIEENE